MLSLPIPGMAVELQPPELLLAICLWAEARGEGAVGMLAVAHVILNRAYGGARMPQAFLEDRGIKLKAVILKPLQFSSFNYDDPNRPKLLEPQKHEPVPWGLALAVSHLALDGLTHDPTHGAVNYLTTNLLKSDKAPLWAKNMTLTAEIGRHSFGIA